MAESENNQQKRQVAYKLSINHILNGKYVKEEGWEPNYVKVNDLNVSRVNVIGVVVLKSDNNVMIDDNTGKISLRVFEDNYIFENVDLGDLALIIGKPREYGNEKYIVPEIIKKIDNPLWAEVRKKEIREIPIPKNNGSEKEINESEEDIKKTIEEPITQEKEEEVLSETEEIIDSSEEEILDPQDLVLNLIKDKDNGEGVSADYILENTDFVDTEDILSNLLQRGDIFEISSGKYKVLE